MKKTLFLLTAILTLCTAAFTGCDVKGSFNGDSNADTQTTVSDEITENEENNDGSGFNLIPRRLNGRAVAENENEDETQTDENEQPHKCKKCRHFCHHSGFDGGEIILIRFGGHGGHRGHRGDREHTQPDENEEDNDNDTVN